MSAPLMETALAVLGKDSGREVWAGVDATAHTWLVFSGFTYAPTGGIFDNGPRLRLMSGYGEYEFSDMRPSGVTKVSVEKSYLDLLIGYQQRFGDLTAKVFVGASLISHDAGDFERIAPLSGDEIGFKAMIELWLNIGERGWASLDAAWAQPFNTTNIRARVGQRVLIPELSIGSEMALNLDESSICRLQDGSPGNCSLSADSTAAIALLSSARAGLFARYDWVTGEASLSLGVSVDDQSARREQSLYVTAQWLTQF